MEYDFTKNLAPFRNTKYGGAKENHQSACKKSPHKLEE